MRLISVTLYRFGSFKEETTFDFPEGTGLFFLRGDNREEPALEANGAGKSTLWNATCWCAFDRTVKGLRAGDVANWEEPKGAYVKIQYETRPPLCRTFRTVNRPLSKGVPTMSRTMSRTHTYHEFATDRRRRAANVANAEHCGC